MDNNQLRAMYNSFGTLNRPQSYGDDLYNDKENLMPAQPSVQTGEDEAGNPIMAPVEMPEAPNNNPILDNIIEYTSNAGPATGLPGPIAAIGDTVVSYIAGNDEQRQQILDRMQRYTPQGIENGIKSVIHSMSNATELEHTKLYENYFYNAEKKNAEIKRIANLLQIDENAFAHDRELYQKAALAADRVERMGKFKKYQDTDGNIDMAKIYADVPGLAEIQQKQGTAAAALALGNIDGIKSINEVYDNAFSRFAGSVYAGARRGWIADRRSAIWNTARKENRLPTAEEQAQLDEYATELTTLPKYNYNTVGNVVGAMVGGAAENLAMIVKSQGAGAVAGIAATRVGGTKAGEIARNAVSTYMMAQDIAGSQYEELVNKVDANGRPMYTPEQASWLALSQGVGEAVLEQYSLNQIGKAIFGRSAAKSITEIIKNSPTLEAAKAGVRDYAALKLSEAGKAGLISLGAEAFEEFTQSASDMLMENMAQVMLRGKDAELSSVEDILTTSTGQMLEALPAIGGFGLIGFGANPIANTRAVLGFRSNVRNVVNNKVLIGRMANAHYGEVLDGVWKNKGNIKELQDKAPESVTTILDTQNRLAGIEDGFIDVRELSKENAELVGQIAEANDISQEELAACLDGSGMLQVKTSTLMQLDLKDEQHKAIRDNVTTSLDAFTLAQENNAIKLVKEQMDSLQAFNDKTYKQAVENIIQARFPDAEQAKLAREIIEANYDNPQEEFKRRLDAVNAEMDEYIAPVLDELRSGMKQGVDIIRMEGDRDASYVKQSNNADWYRNWYADYNRAPNADELRGLAIDIASGRQNARYGLMDYQNNTDETREYFGNVAETLDRLEEQREALMAIRDRMRDLNPGEMVATASLSSEGLKVYDTMRKMMGESENKDVRKAGAFNALFLARYADNMAKAISKARNAPYTAEDFVRDRFRIDVNARYDENMPEAAQLYQESPDGSVGVAPGAVELNAATARDKDTQTYLRQIMARNGLKENEQDAVLKWIDKYISIAEELLEKHPSMKEWHEKAFQRYTLENGLPMPAISAFKNNGEYEYNIDLGSLCTKREALDSLIQLLVDNGLSQKIGPTQYTALSDMLAEMGFLTHCKICFVEGKRVRVLMDANKFSFEWRSVLRALGIEDDNVVGDERHFTPEQLARLEAMTDVTPVPVIDPKTGQQKMKKVKDKKTGKEKLVPETEKAFKLAYKKFMPMYARRQTGDAGITPDKMFMIAKLFKENSSLAGIFKPEWLQTSRGTSWLINEFGTTTSIKSVLASMYGAATSKPLEYFSVYDPLSWAVMFDRKKGAEGLVKHLYDIGGVRAQSFTDFNPMLFVDYVQMVADLAVRKLPMHVYTKVPSFVKLFGETGMMINMSLVARVDPNTDADHAGLVWNPKTKDWDYAWADESFPVEEAFALRENPQYGGRVGTIAVALSDAHMKKLLADPRIDQVIPFHKSGMSEEVLAMTGLNRAKDFTNEQTEKNVPKGMGVISYNELLQEHRDPRKATEAYLKWCDDNGITPTFPKYRDNPNYYKLQEDFRGYNNDGKPVIQEAVRMQLPENAKEILDEAWAERGAYMEKLAEVKNSPQFLEKAMKRLEPQHIDGEVRKEMLRRLRNIMGSKNVISLQQGDFLDALEKSEAQTMGRAAAKNHVEIFRNGQGIVYGFTHNGKIYLNENTFNANTPAHEFTHVWVQVARKVNPKLWDHGKSMLKDTYEWVQVTHDPLYKNIRGDEEAIASEVLARIVGRENEAFVRDFMDKGQLEKQIRIEYKDDPKERDRLLKFVKYGTGKTLRKQIMDWFKELWGSVRSLFDPVKKGQYPTYDEFIHMPLKDLWDNTAEGTKTSTSDYSKQFAKALSEIYKNGDIEDMPASEYENRGGVADQVAASAAELQAAYHGTPNRFERFDTGHIGEGEGHQAHGWGLYFAQDRSVAQGYRNTLTSGQNYAKNTVTINGEEWSQKKAQGQNPYSSAERWAVLAIAQTGYKDLKSAQEWLENDLAAHPDDPKAMRESAQRGLELLRSGSVEILSDAKPGTLFEVDIPENDVLLDEQKEFKDQDKNVQKLIVNAINGLTNKQRTEFISKLLEDKNQRWWFSKEFDNARDEYENEKGKLNSLKTLSGKTWYKRTPENIRNRYKEILMGYGYSENQATELIKDYQAAQREYDKLQRGTNLDKLKNAYETLLKRDEENKEKIIDEANISELLQDKSGKYIYDTLAEVLGNGYADKRAASLFLNEHGIKGITYDSFQDGRCFVVFDDNAIKVLEKYYQQGKTAKGAISLTEQGQKIISLFETADQSTFVHEMAHMFLMDLQEIAGIDQNSQQAKDLDTIMKWAEYKPGQADEYKGTASATEFRKREEAIKEAEAKGDEAEARRLKDVWAQERFARAFEEYLKSGEAPAQGLKRAFRAFKKWLVQIYNDVLGAGVRATPEVEAVMARMVASEEEIDAMDAANAIARIRKVDADILSEDMQDMIRRWQTEAKEQAKEKMLKELMKEYEQNNLKDIDKRLETFRESARDELQNVPCFVCEQLLKDGTDKASALEITGFANEDEYTVALMQAGGSLENALNQMTEQAKANMLAEMPGKDRLYSMAEEALLSGDYNTRLAELEAQLLKRRQARYDNIPARLRNAFGEMDEAIKEFEAAKVKEAVKKLKYAERWDAKNFETIKELESYLAKMERKEDDRAKLIDKFNKKYNELKEKTVRNTKWLQGVRDATVGHARVLQSAAVFRLAEESVSVATNARYWHRQALREAKRAWDNIAGAQRTGREANYNAAVDAKQQQAVLDAMTAQAIKNKKQVDKWLNGARDGFKARAKRIADPKVKANVDMRYFHNHLLYVFGLRNSDAIPPTNYKSFRDLLAELRASHQFEDEVPAWLVSAAESDGQGKNYQQLTMGELEELYKLTRILYRLGLNDKGLLTMDVDMDTVVAECTADWMQNTDYEVGNQRINEVKGAIGSYMNGLLKPEVLLSLLGGEKGGFVKYIYRVLFNAAEAEEIAREKEAKVQRELYSKYYTKEELRAMVNDPVYINAVEQTEAGNRTVTTKQKLSIGEDTDITKENLICMALNWGNAANKARLLVGLFDCENETELAQREAELKEILQAQLTKKDWEFVQAMWDYIGEFADPVSEVMEKSVGVPLDRVKAEAFDVEVDGEVIRLAGGYYPIVKDSSKSVRQTEFEQMEEARALGGVSVFGTGMSATKERTKNMFLNQGPLKLTLDVANNHITAQIHLINAKMAVRDAYKVINNKQIQDMVRRTCGEETVKTMNDWVLNCWAPPIRPRSWYENIAASLRSKTVGAIMGYRVSTALLNAANVVYMAQEIGTKNMLAAMVDFYRHPVENRRMILDISVYMRNRATNMDRDLNAQNEQILKRHSAVGNAIDKATGGVSEGMRYQMEKYANWLIEQTDMMVSMPMYMWQFKQTYSEEIAKGVPEEEARETANYEAVRRMTKVFPSSRAVDSSAIQRTKSEMTKLITPFFSFANTMMNAVWSKYYAGKFKGSERVEMLDDNGRPVLDEDGEPKYTTVKKSFVKRYGRFARAILFNFVLGAMVETLLRQAPDALAGTGDDDEDKLLAEMRKNMIQSAMAGFPGVNEGVNFLYSSFFEKPSYMGGRGVGVLSGTVQRYSKIVTDLAKITQGKESVDAIDLFRDVARAANTRTGISDTLTDAIFNTARFIGDDYRFDDMADLREYIAKTIFDRKLKKK